MLLDNVFALVNIEKASWRDFSHYRTYRMPKVPSQEVNKSLTRYKEREGRRSECTTFGGRAWEIERNESSVSRPWLMITEFLACGGHMHVACGLPAWFWQSHPAINSSIIPYSCVKALNSTDRVSLTASSRNTVSCWYLEHRTFCRINPPSPYRGAIVWAIARWHESLDRAPLARMIRSRKRNENNAAINYAVIGRVFITL